MTIVAIADALLDGAMRARFHAEPIVQATELLLQERVSRDVMVSRPWAAETKSAAKVRELAIPGGRHLASAHSATPATHLLSNGRYTVMLTAAGSGFSRWRGMAVTRWREDATCDDWGSYIYLRDVGSGNVWSAGFQPSGVEPDDYDVTFNEDRAEFKRRYGSLTTVMEVLVSAEDDAEVRRISISNSGNARARDRCHLLCRAGAGPAGGRPRASGVLQAVRRDRVSPARRHPVGDQTAAFAGRAGNLGRRISPSSTATPSESPRSRPTGRVFSAAAAAPEPRSR